MELTAMDADALWAWLIWGAAVPSAAHGLAEPEDDLDFLAPSAAPGAHRGPLRPSSTARWAEAEQGDPGALRALLLMRWTTLARDPLLEDLDQAAAWQLCRALAGCPTVEIAEHCGVSVGLRRAVSCADVRLALAAAPVIGSWGVREAQVEVAARLGMDPKELGHAGCQALLDCLEQIGDGRCVRAMEEVLARVGGELSEHHAWRARHIVQVIRRGGRR